MERRQSHHANEQTNTLDDIYKRYDESDDDDDDTSVDDDEVYRPHVIDKTDGTLTDDAPVRTDIDTTDNKNDLAYLKGDRVSVNDRMTGDGRKGNVVVTDDSNRMRESRMVYKSMAADDEYYVDSGGVEAARGDRSRASEENGRVVTPRQVIFNYS